MPGTKSCACRQSFQALISNPPPPPPQQLNVVRTSPSPSTEAVCSGFPKWAFALFQLGKMLMHFLYQCEQLFCFVVVVFLIFKTLKSTLKKWSERPRRKTWIWQIACSSRDINPWPLAVVCSSGRRMVSPGEGVGRSLLLLIPTCKCPHIYLEGTIYYS